MTTLKEARKKIEKKKKIPFCITVDPEDKDLDLKLGDGRLTKGFNVLMEIVRDDLRKELKRKRVS